MADDGGFNTTKTERRPHGFELTHRRPGAIRLRILAGPAARDVVHRWRRRQITVGRGEAADLQIADPSLSGLHFELSVKDEHVWLRDLGSTNGTWLGNHRVGTVGLPPGSIFTAGSLEIQLLGVDTVEVALSSEDRFGQMRGQSAVMRELFAKLDDVALAGVDTLLQGETGTGKELAARAMHQRSTRHKGPFVVLDCASLSPTLINATLFGHAEGAFTDAKEARPGCVEEANGGTLFIDEVGELPLALQPTLLRVLDRREVVRIGETTPRRVDVRVVAASHRDLRQMVLEGTFRRDLFHRLAPVTVWLPPLRDRGDDVVVLARQFAQERGGPGMRLPEAFEQELRQRVWRGNVRELRQMVMAAITLANGREPTLARVQLGARGDGPSLAEMHAMPFAAGLEAFERGYVGALLRETGGNLSEGERRSGISRKSLRERARKYGLRE